MLQTRFASKSHSGKCGERRLSSNKASPPIGTRLLDIPKPITKEAFAPSEASPYRWLLCALLFLITVNNYMDRQLLSIVAPAITTEFKLSASGLAMIINAFLLAYGIGQVFSGRLMDWVGARRGFTIAVFVWSLAGVCTSFARGVLSFSLFRLLLGAAESGNFPGGVKVLTEWFPPHLRTTAVGIFTSGVSIGAVLTPPIAAYLTVHYGWRYAFIAVGIPGFLWILIWRAAYRHPPNVVETTESETVRTRQWSVLLRERLAWGVIMGRVLEEPVGWLFYSWLPLYLNRFLGVPLINTGLLLMIPFAAQDMGFILGGWCASRMIKAGFSVNATRRLTIFLSAVCMTASAFAITTRSPIVFITFISIATFGHGSWSSNIMSMPGDIVSHKAVGTLYGLSGCGGALGSIVFTRVIGKLVDVQQSFDTVFIIGGTLPVIAAIVMFAVSGRIRRLAPATAEQNLP